MLWSVVSPQSYVRWQEHCSNPCTNMWDCWEILLMQLHAPPPKRPTNRKYTNTSLKMPFATNKHQWENTNLLLLSLVQFSSWTRIVGANFLTITCSLRNYGNESKHTYFHPTLPYIEASITYSQIKILKNMHVVSLVKQKPCKWPNGVV